LAYAITAKLIEFAFSHIKETRMSTPRIAFIGAGNMAASLIGGLRAQGIDASAIRASDRGAEQRSKISAEHGIETFSSNAEAIQDADVIVLSVKPQVMKEVCLELAAHIGKQQLVVSIAAGISCASLEKWLSKPGAVAAIVRCMPNTPALLRQGVSGLYGNAQVSIEQRQQAEQLLGAVGLALWLDKEELIDAVTAVSGSGPAYFFLLIEAMTAAGEKLGLPRETAAQLTLQTALGAARMAVASDVDACELRRRVTSPAGTTEAAIKSFQADGFEALVEKALNAAAQRSAELAEQLGQ
jgi:pyrroline-5-carboxylate reductase